MDSIRFVLVAIFLNLGLKTAVASTIELNSTRMCIKDKYYMCAGELDLPQPKPDTIGFHGMVKGKLSPVCTINLRNGYKEPMNKCYGKLTSNRTLHFVLNKTIPENVVHTELVANFLYVNGNEEDIKKVNWIVKDPKVLEHHVQVNDVILVEGQQCNIAVTKEKPELKVKYKCDTDSFQEECMLIIKDNTMKQVGIVDQQNVPIDLDVPIQLKGSTFTFGLQVCQHEHFITECTVTVAQEVPIKNVEWYLFFIITLSIMCASIGMNLFFWYICMRYRKEKKIAKINYPASVNPLMTPLNEKGDIV